MFDVLASDHRRLRCELRQKVKFATSGVSPVTVGDDVMVTPIDETVGAIDKVLPRRTAFFRPAKLRESERQVIAANLDRLAVVGSVVSPPLKTGLIDRVVIAAQLGQLTPIIVINKVDLGSNGELAEVVRTYTSLGFPTLLVSAITGEGLELLREHLKDHRTIFAGHSGVGKSTLLNVLIPGLKQATSEVSSHSGRGKHRTTTIELFELPHGGLVVDSPGLKVMGLWELERDDVADYYPDFRLHAVDCRFQPCSHSHEPGCAVKIAVQEGKVSRFRHENYLAIRESLEIDL
ncbi:ribosome small subunit-dependent GTPase A [candidate division GN15 bacterium]|uniref:Small ribosomal subunit biogenesis GTPase RsgA n=1 Tax=candidate division GN15 bacterium TaxID=2072418 RepID=A0A855WTT2_9BACT|nr:MAG: ribosome small subunit-dependent GTPase A [candidate division GN15 bacterium]